MSDCYWSLFNNRDKSRFDALRTEQARVIVGSIPRADFPNWLAWKEGTPQWLPLAEHHELFIVVSDDTASHIAIGDAGILKTFTQITSVTEITTTKSPVTSPTISDPHFEFSEDSDFNSGRVGDDEYTRTSTKSFQALDASDLLVGKAPAPTGKSRGQDVQPSVDRVFEVDERSLEIDTDLDEGGFKADLRKSTRYRRRLDAEIEWGDKVIKTKTVDLSLGGCQLDRPLPADLAKRHVKIRLARGRDRLEAFCQVVFDTSGQATTRLRFLDVDRIDLLRSWLISPG